MLPKPLLRELLQLVTRTRSLYFWCWSTRFNFVDCAFQSKFIRDKFRGKRSSPYPIP
ncbi:hypothetical protein PVAP13_4NG194511 [Panicum virgatum]|uniref:Uncharacterized protein n=1 Tax=Panicum virgatum TaxID=38727 RepID=A0A8T0TCM8_PANVG|nr:hypothetical protein PVAP13_4NG194511 [Panicum virgatum]